MMASGKTAKKQRRTAPVIQQRGGLPWLTIAAVGVILALAGTVFYVVYGAKKVKDDAAAAEAAITEALRPWEPTEANPDPSTAIPGIYIGTPDQYKAALHVTDPTRVNYDRFPPVGGPHDAEWAACNGVVYTSPVRNENMVHTLEHGAIWIAYNPDTLAAGDLDVLTKLVEGKGYMVLSPYPGMTSPISLQAWGHQLMLNSAGDERVRQFITALQRNPTNTPEVNGTCSQPTFDTVTPPPLDTTPAPADAVQMDGTGGVEGAVVTASSDEMTTFVDPATVTADAGTSAVSPAATVDATATTEAAPTS